MTAVKQLPPSVFPRASAPPQLPVSNPVERILEQPAMSVNMGPRPIQKRRTYSWLKKTVFVLSPILVRPLQVGGGLVALGLGAGAAAGLAMGYLSPGNGWNLQSGMTLGTVGVGLLFGPATAAGQLVGVIQTISRFKARKLPGGLNGLLEQRDMRRIMKKNDKINQKAFKAAMKGP